MGQTRLSGRASGSQWQEAALSRFWYSVLSPAFPLQAEQSQQIYGEVPFGPHGKAEAAEATAEVQEKGPGHGADTSFPSCEYENPPGVAHLP